MCVGVRKRMIKRDSERERERERKREREKCMCILGKNEEECMFQRERVRK